jgi:hypothetical protein
LKNQSAFVPDDKSLFIVLSLVSLLPQQHYR